MMRHLMSRKGLIATGVAGLLIVGAMTGFVASGGPSKVRAVTTQAWEDVITSIGLRVRTVEVIGREHANLMDVMQALQVRRGEAMHRLDIPQARERLEKLGWIEHVLIERRLPDRVVVRLTERKPAAIWQNEGRFHLVDAAGVVILTGDRVGRWIHLPHLVGEGATQHLSEIKTILDADPRLQDQVRSVVRVGERRWDVALNVGFVVQLPAQNAMDAWLAFAEHAYDQQLLRPDVAEAIEIIDLRLPEQMSIRLTKQAAKRLKTLREPSS